MAEPNRFYRVRLIDLERNTAEAIVSAASPQTAGRLALKEVLGYHSAEWEGIWAIASRTDAITEISASPGRVHAVIPGWD